MIIYMQTKNIYTKSFQFCYYRDLQFVKMSQDLPSANQSFFTVPTYSVSGHIKIFAFSSSHRPHAFARGLPSASKRHFPPYLSDKLTPFPSKLGHVSSTVTVTLSRLAEFSLHFPAVVASAFSYFIYYIICRTALQLFAYNACLYIFSFFFEARDLLCCAYSHIFIKII